MSNMKPIEISASDLLEWHSKEKILYATEVINGHKKQLYVTLFGSFEIWVDGQVVAIKIHSVTAAEFYNNLEL